MGLGCVGPAAGDGRGPPEESSFAAPFRKEGLVPSMSKWIKTGALAVALGLCVATAVHLRAADERTSAGSSGGNRLFEMRTYTANTGKLDALNARFRDHTNGLFKKHGMEVIGYWVPTDPEKSKNTLIYILAYPNKEAREKAWKDFQADLDWQRARAESEKNGALLDHPPESVFMTPTDYSPIK